VVAGYLYVMRRMRSAAKLVLALVALGATFAAGFRFGVHVGVQEFTLVEGSVKAALLAGELRALRTGGTEKIIGAKEVQLDGEVVNAFRFRETGHSWVFWPYAEGYEHDRYLRNVARYRLEYPSPTPKLEFGGDGPHKADMRKYADEVAKRTQELTENYGR